MKMRELEERTGVNRETIRVYLREGLVPQPVRPTANTAEYGKEHVRAVLAVRKLVRGLGMTLPQIKAMLAGKEAERPLNAAAYSHFEDIVASRFGVRRGTVTLASMQAQNPHAAADADVLHRLGIIEMLDDGGQAMVSVTDAALVNIWGSMRDVGFDEAHGFPPELLGYYEEAAELVAGKEAQLFFEQLGRRFGEEEAASMLEFGLPAMLNFFGILRQRAFLRNIRALAEDAGSGEDGAARR